MSGDFFLLFGWHIVSQVQMEGLPWPEVLRRQYKTEKDKGHWNTRTPIPWNNSPLEKTPRQKFITLVFWAKTCGNAIFSQFLQLMDVTNYGEVLSNILLYVSSLILIVMITISWSLETTWLECTGPCLNFHAIILSPVEIHYHKCMKSGATVWELKNVIFVVSF